MKADIRSNIANHRNLIELALASRADSIIFPELSLTGYEPGLAKELAIDPDDSRLDVFQEFSDSNDIMIAVGAPLKKPGGITISMIIFQPYVPRQLYSKQYLHPDEYPYFIPGREEVILTENRKRMAPAICYEISVDEHQNKAYDSGVEIYLASVAKSVEGVEKALLRLSVISKDYSMTVLMSNCIGICDGIECGGRSAIWNKKGELMGQLSDCREGILIYDTDKGNLVSFE